MNLSEVTYECCVDRNKTSKRKWILFRDENGDKRLKLVLDDDRKLVELATHMLTMVDGYMENHEV